MKQGSKRLDGRVAIITGAVQGIGQACAERLAADGAQVIIADLSENTSTLTHIRENGGQAHQVLMDVRSRPDWQRTVAEAEAAFGPPEMLGNVAGVANQKSEDTVVGLTDEGWDFVLDTNLRGTWLGMQAVIPRMIELGGGRIVNIASLVALRGVRSLASYSASKAGVIGLTQQAAVEYAAHGVLVNAICPGTTTTPLSDSVSEPERREIEKFPLIKRFADAAEIAGAVRYLFDPIDGAFSTGMSLPVDGGWLVNGYSH